MNRFSGRCALLISLVSVLYSATVAALDTPGFDRPGIAFSTDTLPPGSFDIEQAVPALSLDADDGVRTRTVSAGSLVRLGILKTVEAQLSTSLFNRQDVDDHGDRSHASGSGDTRIGLKAVLPSKASSITWATLGSITFASGDPAFSNGHPTVSLGITGNWAVSDTQTFGLYGNFDRSAGRNLYTVSPDWNFKFTDRFGGYVEAGRSFGHQTAEIDAGGGFAFMAWPTVQLDLGFLRGLSKASTDLQASFGVSAFFN